MKKIKKTKKSTGSKLLLTSEKVRDLQPDELRDVTGAICYCGTHPSGSQGSQ